jgi:hypothetical protein
MSVRLPNSLHRQLREVAEREGVSMNQLISSAVGEKLAALLAADYLEERATRGSRRRYDSVLRKVQDAPPVAGDELPNKRTLQTRSARSPKRTRRPRS